MDLNALIGNEITSEKKTEESEDQQDISNAEAIAGIMDTMVALTMAFEQLNSTVNKLDNFVASFVTSSENRISTLEKHLSYLLTKDPVVGPQMIAAAQKLKEEVK